MASITLEKRRQRAKFIKENYQTMKLKEMAEREGVNIDCIAQYMKRLKLRKYKK